LLDGTYVLLGISIISAPSISYIDLQSLDYIIMYNKRTEDFLNYCNKLFTYETFIIPGCGHGAEYIVEQSWDFDKCNLKTY